MKWTVFVMLLGGSLLLPGRSEAKPEYARREARACQYCHVSGSPGQVDPVTGMREPTTRNPRGQYYETHNHSFAGYVEPKAPPVIKAPIRFQFVWKTDLDDLPRRLAVADVTGDGKPRLILLHEKPDTKTSSRLTIRKWNGKEFVTEFTGESQASAERLVVGKFAGETKPAVILTADALWVWNGKTFARKPAARPLSLFGAARLKDGQERLILADSPTEFKAYRVRTDGPGSFLTDPQPAPSPAQVQWEEMSASPAFFEQMQMPPALGAGGLIGLWNTLRPGMLLLYHVKIDQDFDAKPDPNDPKSARPVIDLKAPYSYVVFWNAQNPALGELWGTPRIKGVVYDVARSSPADGQTGLLVLASQSYTGPGRTLYYFTYVREE